MHAYYGELDASRTPHLEQCPECAASFDRLKDILDSARDYSVPERGPGYGGEVWSRLLPQLALTKPRRRWLQWWTAMPALATLVIVSFVTGMLVERQQANGISAKARERVLLMAMSDHLERSQIVLAELLHSTGSVDLSDEQDRARDLLEENRLLRVTAAHAGDKTHAALLDDLERVLLDIANSPSNASPADLEALQNRVENQDLLFKVRVTSADARQRGRSL